MRKKAGTWMVGFAVVMLLYNGWRTWDYMGSSLTGVDQWVKFVVSTAYLSFTEIGLLLWLHIALPRATTGAQKTTAEVMVWFDLIGSLIIGLADLAKHNTIYNVDLGWLDPILFMAPWVIVTGNLIAYTIYHMNDSDWKLDQAEQELLHEENQLEIEARRGAIREIRLNRQALSKDLSPHYYGDIRDRVHGRTLNRFKRQSNQKLTAGQDVPVSSNGNGGAGEGNP